MEIFEKIGKTAQETYRYTANQTSKFSKMAKAKIQMMEDKAKIEDIYTSLGEQTYRKYIQGNFVDEDLKNECEKIDILANKVEQARKDMLDLKEKKQCSMCHTEIPACACYCCNCGKNQNEKIVEEE